MIEDPIEKEKEKSWINLVALLQKFDIYLKYDRESTSMYFFDSSHAFNLTSVCYSQEDFIEFMNWILGKIEKGKRNEII